MFWTKFCEKSVGCDVWLETAD